VSKFKINEEKIDKLAHLAVKRGVGLQKGQNLLITAPLESLPLVRKIAEHAYKEGAHIVTPLFTDSDITLSRFKYAPDESFDNSTDWLFKGMGEAFDTNTARMAIAGDILCYYLKWILIRFHELIKLWQKLTNQQERELLNLK
jgi:aminopeptidase